MSTASLGVALQAGGAQDPFGILFIPAVILMIFYLLVFRPQQKKQREHEDLLKTVQKGDKIVTSGGLHGVVVGAADDVLTVDLGVHERVRVKLERSRVERVEKEKGKGEEA
jgi:preprotein translocase subunit YajC